MEKLFVEKQYDDMTPAEQEAAWREIKDVPIKMTPDFVANCIKDAVAPLHARIETLETGFERRFAEMVARQKYCGAHERGRQYRRANSVTAGGNLWIALCDTVQAPGDGPDWQMAVRKGRDGKDATR